MSEPRESRDDLLNLDEVAAFCRVRVTTVRRWRRHGLPIRVVGRVEVVTRGGLLDWIDAQSLARTAAIIPEPGPPPRYTLYRFFDDQGRLLYIGKTMYGASRWVHHSKIQPWWLEVATIRIEHRESAEELEEAELVAIRTEGPRYNVKGMPR